jgi:hypothetical protein
LKLNSSDGTQNTCSSQVLFTGPAFNLKIFGSRLALDAIVPGHGPVATCDEIPRLIARIREILEQSIATGRSPTSTA